MGLEQAILELAASIKLHAASLAELAAANTKLAQNDDAKLEAYKDSLVNYSEGLLAGGFKADTSELEQAVEKVEADAKTESPARKQLNAALEAARAEKKTIDPKPDASGAAEPADTNDGAQPDDAPPLDYEKDVKPLLIKVASKCGKVVLADLLRGVGLPEGQKGDKLDAKQLAAAKKQAEKLIAG